MGLRFVLTGVWPFQGSGHGLALGKERVKSRIEKFGGTVTMSISRLTDALVISNAPGPKKVIEAHNRSKKIITLAQVNDLILGDLISPLLTTPSQFTRFWTPRRFRCSATLIRQSHKSRPKMALRWRTFPETGRRCQNGGGWQHQWLGGRHAPQAQQLVV